jgi:hypothetical protein
VDRRFGQPNRLTRKPLPRHDAAPESEEPAVQFCRARHIPHSARLQTVRVVKYCVSPRGGYLLQADTSVVSPWPRCPDRAATPTVSTFSALVPGLWQIAAL